MKKKTILVILLNVVDQNKRAFCRLIAGADPEFFLGGVHHYTQGIWGFCGWLRRRVGKNPLTKFATERPIFPVCKG